MSITATRAPRAAGRAQAELTVAALRSYADSFAGRNGRSAEGDGEVHAVEIGSAEWLGPSVRLPRPACGAGIGGTTGNPMQATREPVTCLRCAAIGSHRAAPAQARPDQMDLLEL